MWSRSGDVTSKSNSLPIILEVVPPKICILPSRSYAQTPCNASISCLEGRLDFLREGPRALLTDKLVDEAELTMSGTCLLGEGRRSLRGPSTEYSKDSSRRSGIRGSEDVASGIFRRSDRVRVRLTRNLRDSIGDSERDAERSRAEEELVGGTGPV